MGRSQQKEGKSMLNNILAFGWPGPGEWIIIGIIAILIFGNRLPEVGKSLGKGIIEFKRGLRQVKDEMGDIERQTDEAARKPAASTPEQNDPHA